MGIIDAAGYFIVREIVGIRPEAEIFAREIDGVGAETQSGIKFFLVAGGSKQFRLFSDTHFFTDNDSPSPTSRITDSKSPSEKRLFRNLFMLFAIPYALSFLSGRFST